MAVLLPTTDFEKGLIKSIIEANYDEVEHYMSPIAGNIVGESFQSPNFVYAVFYRHGDCSEKNCQYMMIDIEDSYGYLEYMIGLCLQEQSEVHGF